MPGSYPGTCDVERQTGNRRGVLDRASRHSPSPSSSSCWSWCCSTVLAMAHADQDGVGQFGANELVEHHLQALVQRRGGLVEEHRPWAWCSRMRANAMRCCSPGDSTLAQSWTSLSRMTRCGSATLQQAAGCASSLNVPSVARIGHDGAQVAERHVRQLRQEHRLLSVDGYGACRRCTATVRRGSATAWSCRCPDGPGDHQGVPAFQAHVERSDQLACRRGCGPRPPSSVHRVVAHDCRSSARAWPARARLASTSRRSRMSAAR